MGETLADTMEELEEMDMPRGIVAAANKYASEKVPIVDTVRLAQIDTDLAEPIIEWARKAYSTHFDAFIAGAHAATALSSEPATERTDAIG